MEMHQIRYFLAVARTLNFTRAAEECHVAQPSLTRAIKLLEDELGGDLFRRERGHSHLTDLGQRMLPLLQQCYDTAVGAKSLATSIKKGEVASLRLALSQTVDLSLLIPFLRELMRAMNGLELKFMRGSATEVLEALKGGDADLAVAGQLGASWDRIDAWPLFSEPFVLAVNAGHRLAHGPVQLSDLGHERLLIRGYCEQAEQTASLVRSHRLSHGHHHEVSSERDLASLLGENFGVALVPASMPVADGTVRVALKETDLTRTVFVYAVAGRPRHAPAATLLRQLQAADWSSRLPPPPSAPP